MSPLKIRPFLMFQGDAEEALKFYASLFPGSAISDIVHYGANAPRPEGSFQKATFSVAGQEVIVFDSPPVHAFTFTPSFSFFVDCRSEQEVRELAAKLSEGGNILMPLGTYDFSRLFVWLTDRFGVSWQLNLA